MNLGISPFEDHDDSYENHSKENGYTFWSARYMMECLGYTNWSTFNQVISKAMTTCNTLGIPIMGVFDQIQIEIDGKFVIDFKLSRFACYLIAMNGNVAMPQVAQAQAYFASIAGAVYNYQLEAGKVERLAVRSEVTEKEKSLSGVAFSHGLNIDGYGFFQNAGYRGLYNKNIAALKSMRGIPSNRSPLDFMGKDELAANLFRISQTELKIKNDNVRGQARLENTAESVGKEVRATMIKISNKRPEHFEVHEDIKEVKKSIKSANKTLKEIDKPKKSPKKKAK
jgi:DNA-damage-inducible protein D